MNAPLNQHRREPFWDVLKGILIYLVVLGHFVQYGTTGDFWQHPLFRGIYIFHMPLFILVSGYFGVHSLSRPWSPFLRKLFIHLLLPIAVFYLCQLLILTLYAPAYSPMQCFRGMWFLWVLLGCHVTAKFIHAIPGVVYRILAVIATWFLACLLQEIEVPHASYFVFLWPFYILGLCMRRWCFDFYKHHRLLLLLLPLYLLVFYIFRPEWFIYRTPLALSHPGDSLSIYFIRLVCGMVGCAAVLTAVHLPVSCGMKWKWLRCIGQHTLFIYVSQSVFFLWLIYSGSLIRMNSAGALILCALLLTLFLCGCAFGLSFIRLRGKHKATEA